MVSESDGIKGMRGLRQGLSRVGRNWPAAGGRRRGGDARSHRSPLPPRPAIADLPVKARLPPQKKANSNYLEEFKAH